MNFEADGKYNFGLMESSLGGVGTYSVSMKDKKIIVKVSYGDDSDEWTDIKTEVYEIVSILEDKSYNALFYEWSREYIVNDLSKKMKFNEVFYKNMGLMGIELE